MSRKIPSVSFNMDDSHEKELYNHASKQEKFFSKYVKRLIERDRSGSVAPTTAAQVAIPMQIRDEPKKIGKSIAKGFL